MPRKLLLVEDEALIAISESHLLEKHGFEVEVAHSGEEALEKVASAHDISLVLMDIDLGKGIDGTDTARRILQIRDLPIIFLTSHSEKEYVDRVEKISGYGYVLKNSGEFVLVQSIRLAYKLFQAYGGMKESEGKYRAAFMTSPDSVNINRIDGLYVDINEGFTALTGYTREDVIGKLSSEIDIWAIPEDRERLVRGLESDGYVQNLESRFRCKDGTLKTALMSARLIMLKGEPHILSITRDITEKKEIEERFQLAVEGSRDGIWDWNLLTDEAFHSAHFATMLGYEPDELPYTSAAWSKLLHPDDKDNALETAERYLSGEEHIYESTFRMRTKSGEYRWISGRGKAVFDDSGKATRFVGFNTDVTDYKRIAEEADKASRFLDSISDIAYETDTNGTITYANPAVEQIAGVTPEEVVGRPFLPLFREEDQATLKEVYARSLKGEVLENKLTFVNGATCHFTTLPRYGAHGTIAGTFGIGRDMSGWLRMSRGDGGDRARAEKELNESILRYHELEARIPVGVYIVWVRANGEKNFEYVSDRWCELHGVSKEEVMADVAVVDDLVHPDDREGFLECHRKSAEQKEPFCWEGRFFTDDGEVRWFRIESTPRAYQNGDIRFFGVTQDITERNQAEEKYQTLFHYSNDAIFVHEIGDDDLPGQNIDVNHHAGRLLGYTKAELLNLSAKEVVPETRAAEMYRHAQELMEKKHLTFETENIRSDGNVIPVEVSAYLHTEGNTKIVVSSVRDITARKQFEHELSGQKQYLETILETTADGFWVVAPDKRIESVNAAYCRMSGYSADELKRMEINDLEAIENPEETSRRVQRIMENESETFETQHRKKDGSIIDVEVTASRLDWVDGVYLIAFCRDITSRKTAQEKLRRQLSEKDVLLREVNHRVKNNIAQIEGLLALQVGSTENAEVRAALQDAISRVQSMRVLYEKLLVSKDLGEISIRNYAEDLIDSLFIAFESGRTITIEKHISEFMIDAKKAISIGIIINELLTNVFKYAFGDRAGGIVSVSVHKGENIVTLTIQDNGVGIDETAVGSNSPGFGLTIVKMLVEQLNGTYRLVNENGTKSVVSFPFLSERSV